MRIETDTDCPGLHLRGSRGRILYQQDLPELKKGMIKCFVSFFDRVLGLAPDRKDLDDQCLEAISLWNADKGKAVEL